MPKKVNLVTLIDNLGRGGSERQLFLSMLNLNPDKYVRHVVVFHPGQDAAYDQDLANAGVNIWQIPDSLRSIRKRLRYLTGMLRKVNADIVHSWSVHDNAYAGLSGRLAAVPVRWGSLRGSLGLAGFQELPAYYQFASLYAVSRIVVNASSLRSELLQKGVKEDRILLLPNMIAKSPVPAAAVDLSAFGISDKHRVVGTVGNLRYVKNQRLFIEAMADVISRYPDVRGLIVGQPVPGEGHLATELQARIDELRLTGYIVLTGFREDIPDLLHRFDVFCLTSLSEGTPNALLEAMAVGCPVVATSVGGIPDLIRHEKNGLLVPSMEREALARTILRLLENPRWAQQMGQVARLGVDDQHSCRVVAKRLSEYYLEALPT